MADAPPRLKLRLAPTRALIIATAAMLGPPALAEIAAPEAALALYAIAAALAIAAAIDAARALGRAGGLSVTAPRLTRLALGRPGAVELELERADTGPQDIVLGLAASPLLGLERGQTSVAFPRATAKMRVPWRVHPQRRGAYRLERIFVEARSPLRLWSVRWRLELGADVRVYPDLQAESRRLAALFLRRPMTGWRGQRQVGRGRDFEKLREYLPGDGFDEIHWKATAKRGHPVTKVFQVERTQEIYAIVDASRLSGRASRAVGAGDEDDVDRTLLERQINAALALAVAAERQGDLFGLVTYADRPRGFVRAKTGPAHFQACREALVDLQPLPVSPDFRELGSFLRARLTKRALLVFLTSLDDPALAEAFVESIDLIARRHLVLVAAPLPRDAQPLFSGDAPDSIDTAFERLGGHIRWQGLQDLGALLHRHGARLVLLGRDELAAGVVSQYMALKQRQAI